MLEKILILSFGLIAILAINIMGAKKREKMTRDHQKVINNLRKEAHPEEGA